jgi:uncharacterized protein VirK/YbjX
LQKITLPSHDTPGRAAVLIRLLHAAGYARPGTADVGLRHTVSHFLRCSLFLETFQGWYGNPANPALQEALARRPELVTCVVHPYLNNAWTAERKLSVISGHYQLLSGGMGFLRFAPPACVVLADIGEGVQIRLDKPGKFVHEGELTINLFSGELRLYSLVFTLGQTGLHRVAYAGGLQGLHSPDALDIYRTLTHHMNGLRPRDLLVTAFRLLCAALGVRRILAISDQQRVSTDTYFEASDQVFSSYDSAWIDCGGLAVEDGFFELSPQVVHRPTEGIPSRKRAQYRRRYAMIDELAEQISTAVALAARLDTPVAPVAAMQAAQQV